MQRKRKWYEILCDCGGIGRRSPTDGCMAIQDIPVHRCDLAVYSQAEEVQNGRQPTWNSPDITTNDWEPFRLKETVDVRVHNRSAEANGTNALVNCYLTDFGIGFPPVLYASCKTSIIAGGSLDLAFPLDASRRSGAEQRLGVVIETEHPFDTEPINNRGSQCIDGRQTSVSGREFTVEVPVKNPHPTATRRINLQLVPGELRADLDWTQHILGPGEERTVSVDIRVPGSIHGTEEDHIKQPVTLTATYDDGGLIGGATLIARIDT